MVFFGGGGREQGRGCGAFAFAGNPKRVRKDGQEAAPVTARGADFGLSAGYGCFSFSALVPSTETSSATLRLRPF
jgi:hypothetical protein